MRAVFVYGTLMRGERLSHLIQSAKPQMLVPARTQGRLVDLGDFPGLIPARRTEQWVVGEYVEFECLDSVLPQLDFEEEYLLYDQAKSVYLRRLVPVVLEGGDERWAWAYLYHRPYDPRSIIPCGNWRQHVAGRAKNNGG